MIKNKRTSYGLDKRFAQINEFEESGVFEIRMPLDFKLGKNEVKLKLLPEKLLKGSEVLIDIFDANGGSIYYEISKIANEDESRSLIVFIYEDTVPGKCRIFINAILSNNKTYQCQLTHDVLTTVETTQEIKFSEEPKVKYTEKQVQTQVFSTQTRQTEKNGTGDISILSSIPPKQTERDVQTIEKKEVTTSKQSTSLSNNVGSGSSFEIPTFFTPSIITSRNFPFSSSMEGGTIFVNGISLEVPSSALSSTPFLNQSFSASILKVIGTGSIEVFPPFRKTIEYQTSTGLVSTTFDRFFNHSNFTASYKELLTIQGSGYSQSYAVFDLANISPNAGDIDAVEISYKSLNLIGSNYQPVGTFEIKGENLLIDSASVYFKNPEGIVETPIGTFRNGLSSFNQYWQTASLGSNIATASVSSRIVDGIKIDYGTRSNTGSFVVIEPKPQYKINIGGENTQINLSFDSYSESDLADIFPQLDVYISGSEIISEPIQESIALNPIQSGSLGTFIGSISEKNGKLRKNSLTFVSKTSGNIVPKLVSRAGKWHVGNIEIKPVDEKGFNPNQARIYAPMNLPTGSEVNFKIDYLNPVGRRTQTFSTLIEGVFFQGSTIRAGSSTAIPDGTVSGSDQLTGSYDTRYERKGTGIVSSSNQISSDISGSVTSKIEPLNTFSGSTNARLSRIELTTGSLNLFTGSIQSEVNNLKTATGSYALKTEISGSFISASNSLSGRIGVFEGKTLFSGSSQVDYNAIQNKINFSGSGLHRILISSGSTSSSYSHQNLTFDASQSKFTVTGSTNLNGNLFQTGSTSTRMQFIWDGPKVVGTTPGIEWTNMENNQATWLSTGLGGTFTQDADYAGDFTEITQGRLFTYLSTIAGGVTCSLEVQYSVNAGIDWFPMVTLVVGNAPGYKDSNWQRIPTSSMADCYIRLIGYGGDGIRDPRFSPPIVMFR